MSKLIVSAPTALAESVAADSQQGPIMDDQGSRPFSQETIANLKRLTIQIFSNEDLPPHFRVEYAGETANFSIEDCTKPNGDLNKWERNIRTGHSSHKDQLNER